MAVAIGVERVFVWKMVDMALKLSEAVRVNCPEVATESTDDALFKTLADMLCIEASKGRRVDFVGVVPDFTFDMAGTALVKSLKKVATVLGVAAVNFRLGTPELAGVSPVEVFVPAFAFGLEVVIG